jgi:hypothetical protein
VRGEGQGDLGQGLCQETLFSRGGDHGVPAFLLLLAPADVADDHEVGGLPPGRDHARVDLDGHSAASEGDFVDGRHALPREASTVPLRQRRDVFGVQVVDERGPEDLLQGVL